MRSQGHGGVLVPGPNAARLVGPAGLLRPKYGVQDNDFGDRYRQLLQRVLARRTALGIHPWAAYRHSADGELQLLRTELEQFTDLLAALMAVDGALALDWQFGLLGFGVEIAAPTPATAVVYQTHLARKRVLS